TPELKEKEAFILGAKDRLLSLEIKLFEEIRQNVLKKYKDIIEAAEIIAEIDCYCSNAEVSSRNNYIRPVILNEKIIEIEDGRHPVIDAMLKNDFIPNDTYMNDEDSSFFIITGPNMAGKSTFIRQVALLVMLAQTGMFIPASKAKIGIFNKIFTRIGAWDNLSLGQSTFMVEMNETAQILKKSDKNSLVILDEIGRGTSTYDGLSIAWAVTEYLANQKIFTLFATHYHELTASENMNKGIKNFNVAIAEENNELIFLHKIISGSADRSYGIHVAKLAGVPDEVIKKASELLHSFEKKSSYDKNNITDKEYSTPKISMETTRDELSLFKEEEVKESYFRYGEAISIIEELKKIDINNTTPLKALNKLNQLKNKARNMK
ncbi:MAG: DNA mismatch repair protein MutS, partial [Candidatus Muiribacteriota bacterium]